MKHFSNQSNGRPVSRSLIRTLLGRLKEGRDLRRAKVRLVKRSVREQSYENELKLQVAVERLARELDDFFRD